MFASLLELAQILQPLTSVEYGLGTSSMSQSAPERDTNETADVE